ncbi:Glycoprotein-N-acetylgalactosamine 3-beta-galactosyltransferase 1 [Schistosoma japonicum]|nr:Glycoprotein-N-acetylgalactosamine 3-beta-galactosyltransferase 1 [Schistosoma japonicum]
MQLSPFFHMLLIYTIGMFGGGLIVHFYYAQYEDNLYTTALFAAKSPKLTANDIAYKQSMVLSNDSIHGHALQHLAEASLANALTKQVRVFCWILTMPKNHQSKAVHVKATWAGRCNKYLFISSQVDESLPAIAVINTEGRNLLWNKTAGAIKYIAKHYANDYDYFMKADDDSYVVVENLRKLLHKQNPNKPFIMGRRFKVSCHYVFPCCSFI